MAPQGCTNKDKDGMCKDACMPDRYLCCVDCTIARCRKRCQASLDMDMNEIAKKQNIKAS